MVISVEHFRAHFTKDEFNYLDELKIGTVVMRGTDTGSLDCNKKTWEEMELGDIAPIAWRGYIEAIGEVVMRKDSPAMATLQNHGEYHFLYFLRNVERLHVPYARLNSAVGYKKTNIFQNF
jgi:hypothetical protein